jgi:large subunit ribosomal protein L5
MNRLRQKYQKEVIPALKKEFNFKHDLAVPKITKIVLNVGITEQEHQNEALKSMGEQLMVITGQKANITRAHQSIASFKLRAGDPVGITVTVRNERMYQFLDKLISIVLPRVKDFQGVSATAFDGQGNYSLGLEEQIVFPEIDYDKIDRVRSLQINMVTTARNPKVARRLLELMGLPFKKAEKELSN